MVEGQGAAERGQQGAWGRQGWLRVGLIHLSGPVGGGHKLPRTI